VVAISGSDSERNELHTPFAERLPMNTIWRDFVFGARQFKRSPALTVGIILSLGFGIGASGTVFSWMEGTVLRPLPAVQGVDRLITVRPELRNGFVISAPEFDEWRAQMQTVTALAATSFDVFGIRTDVDAPNATTEALYGMYVSTSYFQVLGVRPMLGRGFVADDDSPESPVVAVISHSAWIRCFGGAPGVVGRNIRVNGELTRIIGIAPRTFGGNLSVAALDIWVPLHAKEKLHGTLASVWHTRDVRWLDVIGRLRDGATIAQADAEVRAIAARQAATFVENRGRGARAIPLDMGGATRRKPLFVALVIVMAFVVLLICANIANLLLARAAARTREMAVRVSLGASRGRLVRQLLSESAMLAVIGGALGLVLALVGHKSLWLFIPSISVPLRPQWELNARFLETVIGIAGACVLAFGLAPALVGSRFDVVIALKGGRQRGDSAKGRLRGNLVIAQFVLALSALMCSTMFLRFHRNVRSLDVGYRDGDRVLLMRAYMAIAGYQDPHQWQHGLDRSVERVAAIPGVESAAIATFVPLGLGGYIRQQLEVAGRTTVPGEEDRVLSNGVSPGYFDLMRIPIIRGRPITRDDDATRAPAVVINEAFASRYLSRGTALGRTIRLGGVEHTIIGITRNGHYDYRNIEDANIPIVYYSLEQQPAPFVTLHVRTHRDPLSIVSAVRGAVLSADSTMAVFSPTTLVEESGVAFAVTRSAASVLSVLAAAALLLASMGLFSVVSYSVALRTHEIGIRMALGATRAAVVRMFVVQTSQLMAYAAAVGLAVAVGFSMLLRSRIARLPASSPMDFALPIALLALSALVATLVPARVAAAIDPARPLRAE
jgi:predicted permease